MFAFPNSNGSRGKLGTSVPAGRSWRHSRASRPGPATLHTSTNQVATVLAHKCDITTLSNYLELNPPIFLGFFSGLDDLVYRHPPALLPAPPLSSPVPLSSGACKHGSLCAAQKSCAVTAITVFRRSCEPAELTSRAASNPWKKTALKGAERTKSLEENSTSGCRASKIPEKNSTFGCRANKILGVAVSYS